MNAIQLYTAALEFTLDANRRLREAHDKHDKMGNVAAYGEPGFESDPVVQKAKRDIDDAQPRLIKAFDLLLKDRLNLLMGQSFGDGASTQAISVPGAVE